LEVRRQLGKIIKPAAVLLTICLVVTFALALTYSVTKEPIAERAVADAENSRRAVLPDAESFQEVKEHSNTVKKVFKGIGNGEIVGYVFEVTENGYGGAMEIMVGIDRQGAITDINIGQHNETPGLGSKAQDIINPQFSGVAPREQFVVVKTKKSKPEEIEAITGATVTSRAVTNGVRVAYEMWTELVGSGEVR
jgi:Na+-translocating ferredoxin:NAD+ oxidoreductase subunit G